MGTPSILPFDAPNRQQISQGHPPDWRPSRPMAVVHMAMLGGKPYTALRRAIFTHPTTAEGLDGLFANPPLAPAPRETVSDSGNTHRQASLVSAPGKE